MPDKKDIIKRRMQRTRNELSEAVGRLAAKVEHGVEDASSVIENVEQAFDVPSQIRKRPWAMVGLSVGAGFLVSTFFFKKSPQQMTMPFGYAPPPPQMPEAAQRFTAAASTPVPSAKPNWTDSLFQAFGGEIEKVKEMAIGATIGAVRDLVIDAVPEPLKDKVKDIAADLTIKLGGEPVREPVLAHEEPNGTEGEYHNGHFRRHSA